MLDLLEKSLIEWAATRNDEVVFNPRDGYYSFEIVADAFEKGKSIGKSEMLDEMRKRFVQNLKQAAAAMNEITKAFADIKVKPLKAFIKHSPHGTTVMISVDEATYLDKNFIDFAFKKAADISAKYSTDGTNVHISYIDETSDLNLELLKSDGFDFMFDLVKEQPLA